MCSNSKEQKMFLDKLNENCKDYAYSISYNVHLVNPIIIGAIEQSDHIGNKDDYNGK